MTESKIPIVEDTTALEFVVVPQERVIEKASVQVKFTLTWGEHDGKCGIYRKVETNLGGWPDFVLPHVGATDLHPGLTWEERNYNRKPMVYTVGPIDVEPVKLVYCARHHIWKFAPGTVFKRRERHSTSSPA